MTLSEIADGLEVTAQQRDRGVATVDATGDLQERLEAFANELPCDAASAATVVEGHLAGRSVGESARSAGIAPVTAAKALHLLGCEGVSPLTPRAHDVVADWLSAELSRADAKALTGASETEFALAAFVETHESLDGARAVVEGARRTADGDALEEARSELADLV
ncbi:DUF7858 family protein [Halorussus marinus]|uniref:DUF7858 family protein n=1 Tax=Halorussus marinus TaxID=2505976 RepID=UPI0010928775|nr:hypothetical protein [Halorussus marinus]